MRRIRRGTKIIVTVLLLLAAAVGSWLGMFDLRLYRANLRELKTDLAPWSVGGKDERALIIAPHCDDETLSCGGIISKLVKDGAQVRVVLVTNGDGYHEIVRRLRRAGPKG
ncbi:MAG: PIG-L family deacetylase, partial [Armatimonadetes bacterium]|nr:PIG-L family deacetylase [Armatimonadota bacterium]